MYCAWTEKGREKAPNILVLIGIDQHGGLSPYKGVAYDIYWAYFDSRYSVLLRD